ncbi:MAG: hypothetical protein HOI95_29835 [Chromatiales bacterium]|nr:hypothetical protein [Chromatiales bacterium]
MLVVLGLVSAVWHFDKQVGQCFRAAQMRCLQHTVNVVWCQRRKVVGFHGSRKIEVLSLTGSTVSKISFQLTCASLATRGGVLPALMDRPSFDKIAGRISVSARPPLIGGRFARYLGVRHDVRSLACIEREQAVEPHY